MLMSGPDASLTPRGGSLGRGLVAVLAVGAVLAIAACGGGGSSGSSSSSSSNQGKPVTLNVGVLPIADVAPLYLGMQNGFFKAEKLTIKPVVAQGGAAVVPAVMSGDNQIGFSNVTSIMLAKEQNLPLKPIAAGVQAAASKAEAWDALLSPKGGVTSIKQLAGKKVSVNTLKNLPEVAVRNSLEQAGVDPSTVHFVEIDFPDVPAALGAKRVDAAFAVEPFVGASLAAGAHNLAAPFEGVAPNLTIAEYFTTQKYAQQNADVVARFKRAINKSLEYASQHPAAVRKIIPTYTKTPASVAKKMALPKWSTTVDEAAMKQLVTLSKKYGVLKGNVDVNAFVNFG
jgi:NitT/TauT family transport system substrate-binding protein